MIALGENIYTSEATINSETLSDGYVGGYILADNAQFIDDIMTKYPMIVFPEASYAFEINLDGTFKAIEAARKCNEEQMS